jgi:GTP-binding protein EngB required for normal cell division
MTHTPRIIIVVMGVTGVGKSTFIGHATGTKVVTGDGLESCKCSQDISFGQVAKNAGTSKPEIFQIPGTNVYLVDTPGFDDTYKNDRTILEDIADCLTACFNEHAKISGVLYIHPITELRMKGSAMKNLRMFRKVIGENNMSKCVLVTTKWSKQEQSVSEGRERELMENKNFWKLLLQKGAGMKRFGDSMASAIEIIKPLAEGEAFLPQLTKETVVDKKSLVETAAGREVDDGLEAAQKIHKKEIVELADQHKQALRDKDKELAAEIKAEKRKYEQELQGMRQERELLRRERPQGKSHRLGRWLARGAAVVAGATATVLSAGALAPAAALLYGSVEAAAQVQKAME